MICSSIEPIKISEMVTIKRAIIENLSFLALFEENMPIASSQKKATSPTDRKKKIDFIILF